MNTMGPQGALWLMLLLLSVSCKVRQYCLADSQSIYPSIYIARYLSITIYLSIYLSIYSIYLPSIHQCLSVCLPICLSGLIDKKPGFSGDHMNL